MQKLKCVNYVRKGLFPYLCTQNAIDMSVSFTLEKRTNLHNESPIRLSWSFMGERVQSTLGVSIKKEDWNEKSRSVKADAHNHNGLNADEINFLIKRISTVVMDVEHACFESQYILGKDMMKQVISDALSKDIARPEDILERCLEGWKSLPEIKTGYYQDEAGRYYKLICDAKSRYNTDRFYILQELFGRRDRDIVPEYYFRPFREPGCMYPTIKFKKVSFEEVYGQ